MVTWEFLPPGPNSVYWDWARGGGVGGQVGVEQWEPFPRVPSPRAIHILAPGVCGTLAARAARRRPSRRRPGLDGPPGAAAKSTSDNLI